MSFIKQKSGFLASLIILMTFTGAYGEPDPFARDFVQDIAGRVNQYRAARIDGDMNDNWIRGTYYTGVLAMYQATGDKTYLRQCQAWGEKLNWQIPRVISAYHASGMYVLTCGQVWLECFMEEGDRRRIEPTLAYLEDPSQPNPQSDPLRWYFEKTGLRFVDGLYTSPPAFAMLYRITGEEQYLDWMDACFWDVYGHLFDTKEGLFYRDIRFKKGYSEALPGHYIRPDSIPYEEARTTYIYQETRNGKKVFWSRGNGWAFAGLTRILKYLPVDHGSYDRYLALYREMAASLRNRQQPDGFWYPNLDDPDDYKIRESSGTGFFTYGIAWGINNKLLSTEEYLPVVRKSWKALVSVVSEEGLVQWGQPPAAAPFKVLQRDSHEYISGIFLLAASEVYRMGD